MRRPAERKERDRLKISGERVDNPAAEPVERMIGAVAGFRARGESVPAEPPGHADEDDRADARKRPCPLAVGQKERAAGDEAGAGDGGKN